MLEIVFDFKYLELQDMKALCKKFIYYYSLNISHFRESYFHKSNGNHLEKVFMWLNFITAAENVSGI